MYVILVIVTILGCLYLGIGAMYLWMCRWEAAQYMVKKGTDEFSDMFWYGIRVALSWPWVKIPKGDE
jgi:hypothetical protein